MSVEFWILGILIGAFSYWRAKRLLRRIKSLEERETETAKKAAREEARDIIVGIFADPMPEDHRNYKYSERAKRSLHEHIARVARDSIDPKIIRKVEDRFEGTVHSGIHKIENEARKAINSIPDLKSMIESVIRNANDRIYKEGIDYKELRDKINSPEFIQDVISRIRVLQLCGAVEISKDDE